MADNKKVNFYDILKEMDSVDPNSIRAGIDVVRVKQGNKGTEVTIGIGGSYALGVESGKTIPVLLMMDSVAYESAKATIEQLNKDSTPNDERSVATDGQ